MLSNLVQFVCFYVAFYKFIFSATCIPSGKNVAVDAISWNNLQLLTSCFPQVPRVLIPPTTLNLIIHCTPDWSSLKWIESFRSSLIRASPPHVAASYQSGVRRLVFPPFPSQDPIYVGLWHIGIMHHSLHSPFASILALYIFTR